MKEDCNLREHDFFREIATMVNLRNPRIVRFVTSWVEEKLP